MRTLEGIKVIEVSHAGAMPFGGMILADMGAEVIKVEPPTGDQFRYSLHGGIMASMNRNKRGIVINLKNNEGRDILRKLCVQADVFLENYIPGNMEKFGFGYEDVSKLNPRIIYGSISGFGQTGPYKNLPGYDIVAQAMSGIMMCTGEPDRPPVRVGTSCIDFGSGMYIVIAVLLAMVDREKTGKGQRIDVSLLDTAISWMTHYIAAYSMTGEVPGRWGSGGSWIAPYQVFETADGPVFIGASTNRFWQSLCRIFELDKLARDPKFENNEGRITHREELLSSLTTFFKAQRLDDVLRKLSDSGIPHAPLLQIDQVIQDPHVKFRGIVHEMNHPEYGDIKIVKTPIFREGTVPDIKHPAPKLGQHTKEVLKELGYSEEEVQRLALDGAILLCDTEKRIEASVRGVDKGGDL